MQKIEIPEELEEASTSIRPYKLNAMMKAASKILDLILNVPQFTTDYGDAEFILMLVSNAISEAKGGRK